MGARASCPLELERSAPTPKQAMIHGDNGREWYVFARAGRMPAVRARAMAILAMLVHGHADPCSQPLSPGTCSFLSSTSPDEPSFSIYCRTHYPAICP